MASFGHYIFFTFTLIILPTQLAAYKFEAYPLNYGINSTKCDRNITLFYLRVNNETSSFHFLTDASQSVHPPSVIFCSSNESDSKVSINYSKICAQDLTDGPMIELSNSNCFGLSLYGIRLLNGTSPRPVNHIYFHKMNWTLVDFSQNSASQPDFDPETRQLFLQYDGNDSRNQTVQYRIIFSQNINFSPQSPKFLFSGALNFQMDFSFKGLEIASKFNSIQAHYDFLLHSNTDMKNENDFLERNTTFMSDELTPGIFSATDILLNYKRSNSSKKTLLDGPDAYLQTKPICFSQPQRDNMDSLILRMQSQKILHQSAKKLYNRVNRTLPSLHIGQRDQVLDRIRLLPFTCGEPASYAATKFNSFSFVLGFNQAPKYKLGKLATVILAVSTSVPILSLISLSLFMLWKWVQKRRITSQHTTLTESTQQLII